MGEEREGWEQGEEEEPRQFKTRFAAKGESFCLASFLPHLLLIPCLRL